MAKLTADEQAALDALKAKADAPDDYELWVKNESGREIKVGGPHAQKLLREFGLIDDEPAGDGDGDGDTGEPEPPAAHGYFRGGRR
jgi:hypothetical protein